MLCALLVTRRLVELMGGRMWVESEVRKGSTFHFTLATTAVAMPPGDVAPARVTRRRVQRIDAGLALRVPLRLGAHRAAPSGHRDSVARLGAVASTA